MILCAFGHVAVVVVGGEHCRKIVGEGHVDDARCRTSSFECHLIVRLVIGTRLRGVVDVDGVHGVAHQSSNLSPSLSPLFRREEA